MYPIKSIRSILLDKEQNLWIGSENGLYQFPKTPYINWNQNQGLLEKSVYSICKGYGPGEWWIGFDNLGVCYVKTKNFAVKEVKPILQIGQIIKNNPKINRKKIKGISGILLPQLSLIM
jgi:ligand-binding sensor domain-containing protein